jgi:2Fe-2S ferredoxin
MPEVTFIHPDGSRDVIDIPEGTSVMHGSISNGLKGIIGECGGSAMCATCHVYIEQVFLDKLFPISPAEEAMLESTSSERKPNSRLGCQIQLTAALNGLVVHLPETEE